MDPGSPLLVIFDFDGTLADSWPVTAAELVAAAQPFGFRQLTLAQLEGLRGHTTREVFAALEIKPWRIPKIAEHLRKRFETAPIKRFVGVSRMFETLHEAGVQIGIVSSNADITVRRVLGPDNMARVAALECGASLFGKSRLFKRLIKRVGTAPARTISVGDESRDLDAAAKAGIAGLAVAWGYADPVLLKSLAPDATYSSLADLTAELLRRAGLAVS